MKERILIVDDEEDLTLGYSKCLLKVGYEVKTANSGEEALDLLRQEIFDLVLLDIRLPQMDGMQVLSKAMEIDPDLVILMITAHGSVQSAVDAMKIARESIGRPITNTTMIGALLKVSGLVELDDMIGPLEHRFGKIAEKNVIAMKRAYEETIVEGQ